MFGQGALHRHTERGPSRYQAGQDGLRSGTVGVVPSTDLRKIPGHSSNQADLPVFRPLRQAFVVLRCGVHFGLIYK